MILKLIYLRYYSFLRKYFPSHLGIEDTASSCIIASIIYINVIIIYLLLCKYLIGAFYFNEVVFYLSFLSILILCYSYFVPTHRRHAKFHEQLKKKAQSPTYSLLAIFYPIVSGILLFYTIKLLI